MNPTMTMMLAQARQADARRQAEPGCVVGGDESRPRRRRRHASVDSPSARQLLVAKACELIRLADSLGCKRDELVRMIESHS